MLVQLTIRRIALIDALTVEFAPGLLVLTGETGAGKSIIIGAIGFLLGERTDRDLLQTGAARGAVEAVFDVTGLRAVADQLARLELEAEDGLLLLSRELLANGRSVCRVAGSVVPLSTLRQVTSLLVDLHGQHAHQALLDARQHLGFLDAFGDERHALLATRVRDCFRAWHQTRASLQHIRTDAMERARRLDMLQFQLQELNDARLVADEEIALEAQHNKARHAEKISTALHRAYGLIRGGERALGALDALRQANVLLTGIAALEEDYASLQERVAEFCYALEDVQMDLERMREEADVDPGQIDRVEARLDLLSRLRKKYGATTREMIAYRDKIAEQLDQALEDDSRSEKLAARLEQEKRAYLEAAEALTKARQALAERFTERMLEQLQDLGMKSARFSVRLERREEELHEDGLDQVEFMIAPNPGEPLRPLARIASGGETSRLMLAIKSIAADNAGVPVVIFDEIDTGISGRMAQVVAEKMADIARKRQVLCVTHLPQIAAMADVPYRVVKTTDGQTTRTQLERLDEQGHLTELARMMGGANAESESSMRHAGSLRAEAMAWKARVIGKEPNSPQR